MVWQHRYKPIGLINKATSVERTQVLQIQSKHVLDNGVVLLALKLSCMKILGVFETCMIA